MMTRSGRQYTLPSTAVIPITPANPVTTISPPKWSHKELFGSLDLDNLKEEYMIYPRGLTPGYLGFRERGDHIVTHLGPSFVRGLISINLDRNNLMSL
jgi:hypothetical protein